jgi:hypothetical protein
MARFGTADRTHPAATSKISVSGIVLTGGAALYSNPVFNPPPIRDTGDWWLAGIEWLGSPSEGGRSDRAGKP